MQPSLETHRVSYQLPSEKKKYQDRWIDPKIATIRVQCYGCRTNKLHLRSKRVFLSKDSLLLCWLIEGGSAGGWRSKGKRSCLTYWRQRNSNAAPIRKKKWPLCISIKGLWTGVTDTDTARGSKDRSVAIDLELDWYKHTAAREQLVTTPVCAGYFSTFFCLCNYELLQNTVSQAEHNTPAGVPGELNSNQSVEVQCREPVLWCRMHFYLLCQLLENTSKHRTLNDNLRIKKQKEL